MNQSEVKPVAMNQPAFKSLSIKVIDKETSKPVVGAAIMPVCMGVSPYVTNTYATDSNGLASVMVYEAINFLHITATGYETANASAMSDEAIFKLKKRQ
jgi:hypothetical protein